MRRTVTIVVGAVVAVNLALLAIEYVLPSPSGERSSSLATAPDGFAAWAELARRSGVEVVALRDELADARLPPDSTVVALDVPSLPRADAEVLRAHAEAGGRVVVGGVRPEGWLDVFDPALIWRGSGPDAARVGDRTLATAGAGSWSTGEVLERRGGVALLADASPLQNARLARADNAAFALELVTTSPPAPLVFAEAPHGYGPASGLGALPDAGKWALALLGAAGLLLMLARGKRFGPPEEAERPLAPPRAAYVDALGAALARTRDPAGAMEPIRAALGSDTGAPRTDDEARALARRHAEAITAGTRRGAAR